MRNITIPIYAVRLRYLYDTHKEDDVIGTYMSKDEALKILYKTIVDLAVELGCPITKNTFGDFERFDIGLHYVYLEENKIEVK